MLSVFTSIFAYNWTLTSLLFPGTPRSITSVSLKEMGSSTLQCSCWRGTTTTGWCLCTPSNTSPPCSTLLAAAPSRRTLCSSSWTQNQATEPASPPARSSRRWLTPTPSSPAVSTSPGSNNLLLPLKVCFCSRFCFCFVSFGYSDHLWDTVRYSCSHFIYNFTQTLQSFFIFVYMFVSLSPLLSSLHTSISQHAALAVDKSSPVGHVCSANDIKNDNIITDRCLEEGRVASWWQ